MAKKLVKKLVDRILIRKARIKIVDKDGHRWHPRRKEWTDWSSFTFHQKEYDEELEKTEEEFKKDVEDEIERIIREGAEYRWDISKKPTPGLKLEIDYQDSVIEEVYVEEEIEEVEEVEKVEVGIPVEEIERKELEEAVKPVVKPVEEIEKIKPTIPIDVQRRLDRLESLKREAEATKGLGWEKEVDAYERAIRTIKEIHGI